MSSIILGSVRLACGHAGHGQRHVVDPGTSRPGENQAEIERHGVLGDLPGYLVFLPCPGDDWPIPHVVEKAHRAIGPVDPEPELRLVSRSFDLGAHRRAEANPPAAIGSRVDHLHQVAEWDRILSLAFTIEADRASAPTRGHIGQRDAIAAPLHGLGHDPSFGDLSDLPHLEIEVARHGRRVRGADRLCE